MSNSLPSYQTNGVISSVNDFYNVINNGTPETSYNNNYNTIQNNNGTPNPHEDNGSEQNIGAYYSLLPDRNASVKERWKYWWRRAVFYLLILVFIAGIVAWHWLVQDMSTWFWLLQALWFDLDVTVSKNNKFIRFFHGVAFAGAFVSAVFGSMVIAFKPQFIHDRAITEEEKVAILWTTHCISNYLPVFLHLADLRLNKEQLKKRHYFTFKQPINSKASPASSSIHNQVLRVFWMLASPIILVLLWVLITKSPAQYEVMYNNKAVVVTAMLIADIISIVILVGTLTRRRKPMSMGA